MGKIEKKKLINESMENMPEPILDHILSYVRELEEKMEEENLEAFFKKLDEKYHGLLDKLAK